MTIPNLRPAIKRVFDRMTRAKPQKIIPRSDESPPAAASFKPDLARVEGWDVFDCGLRDDGSPRVEIQRLDGPEAGAPTFETDRAAWDQVVARARTGSALHLQALQLVDPTERKLIAYFCAIPDFPL